MSNIEENEQRSVILHYASISAKGLLETDPDSLSTIEEEKHEIENSLGMTAKDIIHRAYEMMNPLK